MIDNSNIKPLFEPNSIAIIGASNRDDSVGGIIISNVLKSHFRVVVYPVNPSSKSVFGVKCYANVMDIDDVIDLAVIIVPAVAVPLVMEQCGKKGVKAAIIISAGFKEVGEKGAVLEEQVVNIARKYGVRIIGPNCFGIINTSTSISMNTTFSSTMPIKGNVSFVSQSGALCEGILDYARYEKIGFSKFISVGNRADVTEAEILNYLERDEETDVIIMYIESLSQPQKFLAEAVRVTEQKPIIAIKSGATTVGARATVSHTGSMAGSDEVYEGIFEQAGIIRVNSVHELFKAAKIYSKKISINGNGVAILTNSGGPGVMAADAASRYGLNLPFIDGVLLNKLKGILPPSSGFHNPVDVLGDADVGRYDSAMNTLLESDQFAGLINIITPVGGIDVNEAIKKMHEAINKYKKPMVTCLFGLSDLSEENALLDSYNIPHFEFPEDASWTLSLVYKNYLWRKRKVTDIKKYTDVDPEKVRKIIENAKNNKKNMLSITEAYEVLKAYNISVPSSIMVRDKEDLVAHIKEIKYPSVMKVVSRNVVHKFDVGGVIVDIKNEQQLMDGYDKIIENVKSKIPDAVIDGITVEEFIPDGKETIIGMVRDPSFGSILMFGLGGIYVEALHDVSFRLAPIRELSADHMVSSIRAFKLLTGVRGEKKTDLQSISDVLKRVSQLVTDVQEIKELDINPLIARTEGNGSIAVDVRIVI